MVSETPFYCHGNALCILMEGHLYLELVQIMFFPFFGNGSYFTRHAIVFNCPTIKVGIHISYEEMVYHEIRQTGDIVFCSEEFFEWLIEVLKFAKEKRIISPLTMDYTMVMRSKVSPLPDRKGKAKLHRYSDEMESHIFASSRHQYLCKRGNAKESNKKSSNLSSLVGYRPQHNICKAEVDSMRVNSKASTDMKSENKSREKQHGLQNTFQGLGKEVKVGKYSSAYPFIWDTKEEEEDGDTFQMVSTSRKTLPRSNPQQLNDVNPSHISDLKVKETHRNTGKSVQGQIIHDDYVDMPDFGDLLDKWMENEDNSHHDELLAIAESINKNAMMEERNVASNQIGNENVGTLASSDSSNVENISSEDHDQSALHNKCQSDERQSMNEMKSVTPLHLDNKTSFLFAQPYFPGYYSPALWNRQITQNVTSNIMTPVPPLQQLGEQEVKHDYPGAYYVDLKAKAVDEKVGKYNNSNDTSAGLSQMELINSHVANNSQIAEETRELANLFGCMASSSAVTSNDSLEKYQECTSNSIDIGSGINKQQPIKNDMKVNYELLAKPISHPTEVSESLQMAVEHDEKCESMATHSGPLEVYHGTSSNANIGNTSDSQILSHSDANEGRSRMNESDLSKSSELLMNTKYEYETHSTDLKKKYRRNESTAAINSIGSVNSAKDSSSYDNKCMSKERQWVKKMANERGINVDDYDYKDLRKKMFEEYYRKERKKKAMAKRQTKENESMRRRMFPDENSSMPGNLESEGKERDFSSLAKGVEWQKTILAAEEKPRTIVAPSFTSK